jgi:hypothetical protein
VIATLENQPDSVSSLDHTRSDQIRYRIDGPGYDDYLVNMVGQQRLLMVLIKFVVSKHTLKVVSAISMGLNYSFCKSGNSDECDSWLLGCLSRL